jgi:DNA topoisomerase-1
MTSLVIVESPAKCKKIESYLGKGYKCIASFGHICELKNIDKENNYDLNFKLVSRNKNIKPLLSLIKKSKEVILATDDDREGEAIAWHICRVANLPITTTKRIIFHEITKSAIQKAMASPTTVDMKKVNSQLARQSLDRLVGFGISPLLWKKFYHSGKEKKGLSAGRCQTPALRLIYENQKDIDDSTQEKVYNINGMFTDNNLDFSLDKNLDKPEKVEEFLNESISFNHELLSLKDVKEIRRSSPNPFSTSSLQQGASNKLGFSPKRTMLVAQKLYEAGHITYMRTDNKKYSKDFIVTVTDFITGELKLGNEYIKKNLNLITNNNTMKERNSNKSNNSKGKKNNKNNAQEAHEAIRPTNINNVEIGMDNSEKRLYNLIRTNALESCMSDSIVETLNVYITAPLIYKYRRQEERVMFPGWLIINGYNTDNKNFNYLKSLFECKLKYKEITAKINIQNFKTHYTESKLIQLLEKNGIGRPSTFSSLISKIQERKYVNKCNVDGKPFLCEDYLLKNKTITSTKTEKIFGSEKNKLIIQPIGIMVLEFLTTHFDDIFNYEYTSLMEEKLDNIASGNENWKDICIECDDNINKIKTNIDMGKMNTIKIDETHTYMVSKWGPVIKHKDEEGKITYKKVKKNLDINKMRNEEIDINDVLERNGEENKVDINLGTHEGNDIILKNGRFGPYVLYNSKTFSVKGLNKPTDDIQKEDVIDIITGKKSANPNIIKIINNELSIRKGKYGEYVFYKKESMNKPRFFQLRKVFQDESDKKWRNYSDIRLVNLINVNCL